MVSAKIIDEEGVEVAVENMEVFAMQLENTLLVNLYKSTIFWHEKYLEAEEGVKEGVLQLENAEIHTEYEAELVENAIKIMREEVVERWDVKTHNKIIKDINF